MLQYIMMGKVEKSKQNIQAYLSTNSLQPKQQAAPQPGPSKPISQPISFQSNNLSNTNLPKPKLIKNEIDVKLMSIQGKQVNKQGMQFRFSKEESKFQFIYEEEGIKTKLQGKRESLMGKRVKPNYAQGSCTFEIKQAMFKKQDTKESAQKGAPVWSNGKQVNEQTVIIWLKDKDQLKPLIESPFMEGLVDLTNAGIEQAKPSQAPATNEEGAEIEQDHSNIKLTIPTPAQQGQVEKIRKIIKQMKEQDKNTVLIQIFKIKKQYDDPTLIIKKLKCPIHFCEKSYKDVQQLKTHLKQKHPELSKHGIQLSEYDGTFEYGSKAMDLALFIGKMYPQQMKKIIKQMKTKQAQ